jgi:hypothetical protein
MATPSTSAPPRAGWVSANSGEGGPRSDASGDRAGLALRGCVSASSENGGRVRGVFGFPGALLPRCCEEIELDRAEGDARRCPPGCETRRPAGGNASQRDDLDCLFESALCSRLHRWVFVFEPCCSVRVQPLCSVAVPSSCRTLSKKVPERRARVLVARTSARQAQLRV